MKDFSDLDQTSQCALTDMLDKDSNDIDEALVGDVEIFNTPWGWVNAYRYPVRFGD